jgi:hypothetical protein
MINRVLSSVIILATGLVLQGCAQGNSVGITSLQHNSDKAQTLFEKHLALRGRAYTLYKKVRTWPEHRPATQDKSLGSVKADFKEFSDSIQEASI